MISDAERDYRRFLAQERVAERQSAPVVSKTEKPKPKPETHQSQNLYKKKDKSLTTVKQIQQEVVKPKRSRKMFKEIQGYCANCDTPMYTKGILCSSRCSGLYRANINQNNWRNKPRKSGAGRKPNKPKEFRKCNAFACDRVFEVKSSQPTQQYCSRLCWAFVHHQSQTNKVYFKGLNE